MKGKIKMIVFLLVLIFISVLAYLFYTRSNPVVYSYYESGRPNQKPFFSVFNPLRDKKPEKTASDFLTQLKEGQCDKILGKIMELSKQNDICERETRLNLLDWRLTYREDDKETSHLYYDAMREGYDDFGLGAIRMIVKRQGNEWMVVSYLCVY